MQSFCEGITLSTKHGVKPELMLDILENSAAKSGLVSFKAPYIFKRDFKAQFSTKWLHKDVGLALESAKGVDLPLPVTAQAEQMLRAAIAKGWGDDDFCGSIRNMEEWAAVQVKS